MIFASSEIIEAAVHVTFYLNSSITEVYCWQLLCLDMFLISLIVLTFVTLHLTGRCCPCAPPVPRPPRQTNHNRNWNFLQQLYWTRGIHCFKVQRFYFLWFVWVKSIGHGPRQCPRSGFNFLFQSSSRKQKAYDAHTLMNTNDHVHISDDVSSGRDQLLTNAAMCRVMMN